MTDLLQFFARDELLRHDFLKGVSSCDDLDDWIYVTTLGLIEEQMQSKSNGN